MLRLLALKVYLFLCDVFWHFYRLEEPILLILYRAKTVFMHSPISLPKVNNLDDIWNNVSQIWGAGPGRFWARWRQFERDHFSKKCKNC